MLDNLIVNSGGAGQALAEWIEYAAVAIEILAVVIIVLSIFVSVIRYVYKHAAGAGDPGGSHHRAHRTTTAEGDPGLNYLCTGWYSFFTHIDHPMRIMVSLMRAANRAEATALALQHNLIQTKT